MTTSAPGKLMLFGEHAVVYGHPCIVTAISERLYVSDGLPEGDTRFLDAAVAAWGKSQTKLAAKSSFSGLYGFGSSSAVTVAALKYLRPDADNKTIFDAAYTIVLDIQGTGSGFDVAAAVYGGTLYYIKNTTTEPLAVQNIPLVVGYTGTKADTTSLINAVAAKKQRYPQKVDRIFQAITTLTNEAKNRMMAGEWDRVGKLMDFNQEYLRDLGVSSEKLESLIQAAKGAGAWGAKLSGAGGGDCMIALAPPERQQAIIEAIGRAGGEVVDVASGARGVRMETTTDDQEELFIVVDKDDNIVGYKTRFECHHNPLLIHRTVGVLIYNDKGQLLLQKRSSTKDMDPGFWGISAAGHVTRGQTDEEAVKREMKEEIGIEVPVVFVGKYMVGDTRETERTAIYKGMYNGPFIPHPQEVASLQFFDPREIRLKVASKEIQLTYGAEAVLKNIGVLP
jgi:mevalonate kinase